MTSFNFKLNCFFNNPSRNETIDHWILRTNRTTIQSKSSILHLQLVQDSCQSVIALFQFTAITEKFLVYCYHPAVIFKFSGQKDNDLVMLKPYPALIDFFSGFKLSYSCSATAETSEKWINRGTPLTLNCWCGCW